MKLYPQTSFLITVIILSFSKCFGYIKLGFENERNVLCNKIKIFSQFTQYLRHHDNSGLILEHSFEYHNERWRDDLLCSFKVSYPTGTDGVIAVIQSLSMRKNETGQCIDYIQFSSKDATTSHKFCGNFDVVSRMSGSPNNLDIINYDNSFRTKQHKMHVYISIGKEAFRDKSDTIEFKVVFTAYKNCSDKPLMDLTYRPCRETSDFCIYNGFFNDDYVNCPLRGCVDEGTCSKFIVTQQSPSVGTKLLVSSISFLFVLFVCFLISVWACKKHKVICFSDQFSNPERNMQTRVIEMQVQGSGISAERQQIPSAPAIELDKDLPPKYEDLFPDR